MCDTCLEEKHAGVIYGLHTGDYQFRYIGQSRNLRKRFSGHIRMAIRGGKFPVHEWIRKHGPENIHLTILRTFTDEDVHLMDEEEIFHIWQAREYGEYRNLNILDGGGGTTGRKHSEETKAKIGAAGIGRKLSEEAKAKISAANSGRVFSAESRAKMSASKKNMVVRPEVLAALHARNTGRRHTEEAKARMSATQKGIPKPSAHTRYHTNTGKVDMACSWCRKDSNEL